MLEGYLPRGFEKSCTNALIKGIKECEFERDTLNNTKDTIERSLKLYKEEGKQLHYVANNIQEEVAHELRNIIVSLITGKERDEKAQHAIDNLKDFLKDIVYQKVDYYEVARQLTKYYKESQKIKAKKAA
jgi:malonyl CoA-acyl carrier protein transacylase